MSMTDHRLEEGVRRALVERSPELDTDAAWNRLRARVGEPGIARPGARLRLTVMFAIAALTLGAGIAMARLAATRAEETVRVATAATEQRTVTLNDGSAVTLAPQTMLRFRREGSNRVAELSGHATFTVAPDPARPFVVRFAEAEAVTTATEFIVRSFPGDSAGIVAVVSGEVALRANAAELRIGAGQAGQVTLAGEVTRLPDAAWVFAWSEGRLLLRDVPLAAALRGLERWFDIDARVPDSALARRPVRVALTTPTLENVLDSLAAASGARYAREGRIITFLPRER